MNDDLDKEIYAVCTDTLDKLKSRGAEVSFIDLPVLDTAVPAYYIIVPAEISTDLARFDGLRF